nr:N-acetylglucosamine-6-phosphate deacetylase [uncultured Cellulosilyticum sp.]
MIITNCHIIYKDRIEFGSVRVEAGKIKAINPKEYGGAEVLDAKGLYLSPGFIDVHIHGANGCDTMDGTIEAINNISKAILKHGTTSFLPTTMTVAISEIQQTLKAIKLLKNGGSEGAQILGAHLEGPFVSPKAIGAQNPRYLERPSIETYKQMVAGCEEAVVSITLAPELEGAKELIAYLKAQGIVCSAGHTMATYEEMQEAIGWGISHSTHLYNAMRPFNHRAPGVVGAIFDSNITTETIADGIHSTYSALRIAYKQKGTDKVLLISDAMMACCMPSGDYALGGQKVIVKDGAARLENGALAGSVLTLDKAVRNVYENCNLPLYEAVKMATYNPAKLCKVDTHKGLIQKGYDADLLLFDEKVQIKKVFIKGQEVYSEM